jgi:hypothetical protein
MSDVADALRRSWLGDVLIAMARPLLPAHPRLTDSERIRVEADLAGHLRAQVRSMPTHLRAPIVLALLGFDSLPRLRWLRSFRALPPDRQARVIEGFARSPIPQLRDLVKLVRSIALFAYLDHQVVSDRLWVQSIAEAGEGGTRGGEPHVD